MRNNNYFKTWMRGIMLMLLIASSTQSFAQTTLATTFANNNGSSIVIGTLQNANASPIIINSIQCAPSVTTTQTFQLWTKPVSGFSLGAPGAVSAANGWTLQASNTLATTANTTSTGTACQTVMSGLNVSLAPGFYRFCISGSSGIRYSTVGVQTCTFTAGGVTLNYCTSNGYGGTLASPTNTPRGLVGAITFSASTPCSGVPAPGNTVSSANPACPGSAITLSLQNNTSGTGVTYQWFANTGAGYSAVGGATNSTYITTQTIPTSYYCDVTCSAGGTTSSNPLSVTMNIFSNCYCSSTASSTADEDISNVTFGSLNNSSGCATLAPGPGSVVSMYSNYKSGAGAPAAPVVSLGQLVPFSVTQTTCGGAFGNSFDIYIDYNQNGSFADAGELVWDGPLLTGSHTDAGNITIPNTATSGTTAMRVINVEGGATSPCQLYTWGETEDYLITIAPLPANPANPTEVGVPNCATGGNIQATGSAPSGETWYWQSSASGTSTAQPVSGLYPILANGTYYIRSQNNTYLTWSAGAGSITVSDFPSGPADPTTSAPGGNPACGAVSLVSSVALAGTTNYWQGTNSTGTSTASVADNGTSNTPFSAPGNGTYYLRAQDNTSFCWSNPVATAVSIYPLPTAPVLGASPTSICPGASTALTAVAPSAPPTGYSVSATTYNPTTPPGATSPGPVGDDVVSSSIPLGFSFNFYGTSYSNIVISTNGFISFDASPGSGCCAGQAIPSATAPNNVVAICWTDLNTGTSGNIDYYSLTSPNRFVVRFNNVGHFAGAANQVNGQIIIYQSGQIEIHNTSILAAGTMTCGLENSAGTLATAAPGGNASTTYSATNNAWLFSPTQAIGFLWSANTALNGGIPAGNEVLANTSATPSATGPTIYTMTLTDPAHGCQSSNTVTVNVLPVPPAPTGTGGATACGSGTVTLTATGTGGTLNWYNVFTGGTIQGTGGSFTTPVIGSNTDFYVEETNGTCTGPRATVTATYTSAPSVTASSDVAYVCQNGVNTTANLSSTDGSGTYTSFTWQPGALSGQTVAVTPSATTTYTVTASNGTCSNVSTVTVNVGTVPTISSVTANPAQVCQGGTSQLTATVAGAVAGAYVVNPITYAPVLPTGATTPGPAGDDVVSSSIPIGFSFNFYGNTFSNVVISTNGFISFDAAPGAGCCSGQLLPSATAPNNVVALAWTDLNTGTSGNIDYFNLTSPNRFVVRFTNVGHFAGIANQVSGEIILYQSGIIEVHNSSILAAGTMTQGIENGAGTVATPVSGRNAATWSATNDAYQFYLPPAIVLTYAWSPAGSLSDPTIYNPIATLGAPSTTYSVNVSDVYGCTATGSVVLAEPSANPGTTSSTANPVCGGASFTLSVSNPGVGAAYQWQSSPDGSTWTDIGGATNSTYAASQTADTYYRLGVGCGINFSYSSSLQVTMACVTPVAGSASSSAATVCGGTAFTLSLTGNSTTCVAYQWQSSPDNSTWTNIAAATNATLSASQLSDTYYRCVVSCSGGGASANSGSVQVTMNTNYLACYCQPTTSCTFPDIITNVTFDAINRTSTCDAPTGGYSVYNTPNPVLLIGSTTNLSVTTGGDLEGYAAWIDYNHSGSFEAGENLGHGYAATNPATYTAAVTIPAGAIPGPTMMRVRCTYSTDPFTGVGPCGNTTFGETEDYLITIAAPNATSNSPVCQGSALNLFSPVSGLTYSWTTTAANAFTSSVKDPIIPNATMGDDGVYTVHITFAGGSFIDASVTVVINPSPVVAPTASAAFCETTAALDLHANAPTGVSYLWTKIVGGVYSSTSSDPSIPSAPASASGTYKVRVTDANGCRDSANVVALVYALPPVAITVIGSNNLCTGQTTSDLQGTGVPASGYSWSTTETTDLITVSTAGTYVLTGTDVHGCINTSSVSITASAPPAAPIVTPAGPINLCSSDGGLTYSSATLTVTNYSTDLLWSTSETTTSITVDYGDIFNVTYTDPAGCYSVSNPVVTNALLASSDPTSVSSNITTNNVNNICLGNNVTLSVNGGSLGDGATWHWYEGTGACGTGTARGTGSSVTITPSSAGVHHYTVRAEGTCGPTNCSSIDITVSTAPPSGTVHITAAPSTGCNGTIGLVSVNAVSGATYYSWNGTSGALYSSSNVGPFVAGPYQTSGPSVYVNFANPAPAGNSGYNVCGFAANACGQSNTICTWVRSKVSQPGVISGGLIACASSSNLYSIAPVVGANTYTWTITGNANINGGGTTLTTASPSITVNFLGGWSSGTLSVYASLTCGFNSAVRNLNIVNTPAIPGTMSGPGYVCPSATSSFSVSAVPGAASYNWTTTVPGAVITPAGNTASIAFPAVIPAGSLVCVTSVSSCGFASPQRCKSVASGIPNIPGNISGPASGQCGQSGISYTITPVFGATSYLWSTSTTQATISGPNNLSSASVNFSSTFSSVVISVVANSSCGSSAARTLSVAGFPGLPAVITGNATPCAGIVESYTTAGASGATAYTWAVPAGSSIIGGQGSANILVLVGTTAGNITVTASNDCGSSGTRTFAIIIPCRQGQVEGSIGSTSASLYPNPTSGKTTVKFESSNSAKYVISVVDVTGRVIISDEVSAAEGINAHELDLTKVAKGIYLVRMETAGEQSQLLKVTVE